MTKSKSSYLQYLILFNVTYWSATELVINKLIEAKQVNQGDERIIMIEEDSSLQG